MPPPLFFDYMDPDPLPVLASDTVSLFAIFVVVLLTLCLVSLTLGVRVALEHLRTSRIEDLFADRAKAQVLLSRLLADQERLYASATTLLALFVIGYGLSVFFFFDGLYASILGGLELSLLSMSGMSGLLLLVVAAFGVLLLSTIFFLFFTRIATEWPERYMLGVSWVIVPFLQVLFPFSIAALAAKRTVARVLGLPAIGRLPGVASLQELEEMVKASRDAGELEGDESVVIEGALGLSDNSVSAIMTPRKDVVALSVDASFNEVYDLITEQGFSRYPVVGEDLDDIRGVFLVKDFVPCLAGKSRQELPLEHIMRPAVSIQGSRSLTDLLRLFRDNNTHFAVVLDEHGGVDGVVTMDDLVEELLGDVHDEHDEPDDDDDVRETKAGDLLIEGSASVNDLNEDFDLHIPECEEYDTVAGWFIHALGRLPGQGDEVSLNGFRIRVEKLNENRITLLRLKRKKKAYQPQSEA